MNYLDKLEILDFNEFRIIISKVNGKYITVEENIGSDKEKMTFTDAKKFIDLMIDTFPKAGKYIVDPTGSGEPLLEIDLLLRIGEYCKKKSNTIKKEVLPMIVTNGTLLDSYTVSKIREAGILFGVSLDGDKKRNDFFRLDNKGNMFTSKLYEILKQSKIEHSWVLPLL